MATHSSILAWRIPGAVEPGGLPSMGLHRKLAAAAAAAEDKAFAYNVGDPGLIPGSGRSPRIGNGNPLQYCCLENPMD